MLGLEKHEHFSHTPLAVTVIMHVEITTENTVMLVPTEQNKVTETMSDEPHFSSFVKRCITCKKDINVSSSSSRERRQHTLKETLVPGSIMYRKKMALVTSLTSTAVIQHRDVKSEHPYGLLSCRPKPLHK